MKGILVAAFFGMISMTAAAQTCTLHPDFGDLLVTVPAGWRMDSGTMNGRVVYLLPVGNTTIPPMMGVQTPALSETGASTLEEYKKNRIARGTGPKRSIVKWKYPGTTKVDYSYKTYSAVDPGQLVNADEYVLLVGFLRSGILVEAFLFAGSEQELNEKEGKLVWLVDHLSY